MDDGGARRLADDSRSARCSSLAADSARGLLAAVGGGVFGEDGGKDGHDDGHPLGNGGSAVGVSSAESITLKYCKRKKGD